MKALITGASSGIGRDIAKVLDKKGYELVLVARDEEKLKEVAKELKKAEIIATDLSIEENCKKIYEKVPDVDLLVNNAGFGDCGDFTKTSLEKEIKMIQTNVIAYHILTKLYLINFKNKNSGKILNVASIAGFMPGPLMSTYYATKSYVVRLSESIREELKQEKSNVKISILCPGPVDTNFNKVANVKFHLREANRDGQYQFTKDLIDLLKKHKNVNALYWWQPEEAGNGDDSDWKTGPGATVMGTWLTRGMWWCDQKSDGHWPVVSSQGFVGKLLSSFLNTTGINDITAPKPGSDSEAWFTISGIRIDKPTKKGLYIHSGKVISVK